MMTTPRPGPLEGGGGTYGVGLTLILKYSSAVMPGFKELGRSEPLLTELLLPALCAAAPSRVLWVSSGGMYSEPLSVGELEMGPDDYDGVTAYARAKRAQVTLTELYADRLLPRGVVVHAMHPGWADTPGVARSLPMFRRMMGPLLRTPADGADTLVWLAANDDEVLADSGLFWLDRRPRPIHRLGRTSRSDTPEERARLLKWVNEKAGLPLSR